MFCPCCAGRAIEPSDPIDERGNSDGKGRSTASEQFGIHRTLEHIERDLLGVPLPVIANLVNACIVSLFGVLMTHCSRQNSFATVCLIGYTARGYSDTRYGGIGA